MKTRAALLNVLAGKTSAKTSDEKLEAISKLVIDGKTMAGIAILGVIAGVTNAKTSDEKIADIKKILDEEEEAEAADEDGDGVEDEEDEEEPAARARGGKRAATVDPAVAQAILDLPEATGREALARRLAFKPGMTVAEAKADLAAAPKASALGDRVRDPKLSGNGGKVLSEEEQLDEAAFAVAGIRPRARRQ